MSNFQKALDFLRTLSAAELEEGLLPVDEETDALIQAQILIAQSIVQAQPDIWCDPMDDQRVEDLNADGWTEGEAQVISLAGVVLGGLFASGLVTVESIQNPRPVPVDEWDPRYA